MKYKYSEELLKKLDEQLKEDNRIDFWQEILAMVGFVLFMGVLVVLLIMSTN